MAAPSPLIPRLAAGALGAALEPPLADNVDPARFPGGMPPLAPAETERRLTHLFGHAERWEWLAGHLDPTSRGLLLDLLRFHLLGPAHARVGPSAATVAELVRFARAELVVETGVTPLAYAGTAASDVFDLVPLGLPIVLESYLLGVQGTFQLQQYRCPGLPEARPRAGDVALDAGGCFGETALWLAHAVGPDGHVLTLEFAAGNLALLRANLARNPQLAARVAVAEAALWERADERLAIDRDGPASSVATGARSERGVPTVALDALLADGTLSRVDFVKMDIEGAEPAALRGAEATLRRFRPRLALAAYHDVDHLWQLPQFLDDLGLGYRFALGHFTMHAEETVLYAVAGSGR